MKIVYLFYHFAQKAGTERILINKMNWLAEHGYDIYALTYEQGDHPFAFPLSDKVQHIDLNTRFYPLYKYSAIKRLWLTFWLRCQFLRKLREFVIHYRPDVMVCTTYAPFEIKALTKVCRPLSIPFFIESHHIYLKTKDISLLSLIFHRNKPFTRNHLIAANRVVSLTEDDAKEWRKVVDRVDVIPNMVNPNLTKTYSNQTMQQVIFACRLEEDKGLSDLLDVWKIVHEHHPDWTLQIYGTGTQKNWFIDQVDRLNIGIHVHNPVADIMEKYRNSSILILTSILEPFGLVLVEAMSCGLPVVAFDCPYGPAKIITDSVDGFLIKHRDIKSFANRVCQLIEDKELRHRMGHAAIQSVHRYSPEQIMPKWQALFESIKYYLQKN